MLSLLDPGELQVEIIVDFRVLPHSRLNLNYSWETVGIWRSYKKLPVLQTNLQK